MTGVEKKIEINRDEHGVVYISAETDRDVYFAMGYVHAQDRLWQLELQRRLSQGRLSEIFGRSAVEQDIWMRTLGIYAAARAAMPYLSQDVIASLEAYSAGINAWLDVNPKLPIEFSILDVEPEPWKSEDSLAWAKVFALNLGGNFRIEMQRFVAAQYLTGNQLRTVFPGCPFEMFARVGSMKIRSGNTISALLDLQQNLGKNFKLGGQFIGSNAWVVSGHLTDSGAPMLANDPHLGLQIPSLWYSVVQNGASLKASGMSLIGLPVVLLGKNEDIAWGATNMMADVQDLYLEQPSGSDPKKYKYGEKWLEFKTHNETFQVKADFPSTLRNPLAPVEIQIRRSVHGPIISDMVKGFEQPVALRWTALENEDTSYESFYRLSYATDWHSFKEALKFHVAPVLNFLYADVRGNIGFIGAGRVPVRKKGEGALPNAGADDGYEWIGYVPFSDMPQSFNPEKGYLVSANNRNIDDDYPYFISLDWAPPARANRIEQLLTRKLDQKQRLTLDDMKKIQADSKDLSALKLLTRLQRVEGKSRQQKVALNYLRQWSGVAGIDSQGATIFYSWLRHLRKSLFADELQAFWNKGGQGRHLSAVVSALSADTVDKVLDDESEWCDDISTPQIEGCSSMLELSLQAMLIEMTKLAGSDINEWHWGEVHHTLYEHVPFSQMKILDTLFERSVSNGGSANTINVSGASFKESEGYMQGFGAGFRQIIQMASNKPVHLYMNSTGQSGQIASSHYDDMVEAFRNAEYYYMDEKKKDTHKLTLYPQYTLEAMP